jgi:NADH-quinone oxidoreductase B subunit
MSAMGPRFDVERFGVLPKTLPTEADLLLISGPITEAMREEVIGVYRKMKDPKYVISIGSCANTGGMFAESKEVVPGVDALVPVDLYIPGCPPRPEALIHGLLRLQERIRREHGLL